MKKTNSIRAYSILLASCYAMHYHGRMCLKRVRLAGVYVLAAAMVAPSYAAEPSLAVIQKTLVGQKLVDLTHAFEPGIPHWAGFPNEKRETIYWYEKGRGTMGTGFFAETFTLVGQWGTHVDPPAHFTEGLRTVDQIELKEMILPMVVIDVHAEVEKNPDYTLTLDRVKKWESDHGAIPEGAFVALRTDWSKRWPMWIRSRTKTAPGSRIIRDGAKKRSSIFTKSARLRRAGTRQLIPIRGLRLRRGTIPSKPTFWAPIIIR